MSTELETLLNTLDQLSLEELLILQENIVGEVRRKAFYHIEKPARTITLDWQKASAEEIIAEIKANRVEREQDLSL